MKIGIPLSDNDTALKELLASSFHHTSLLGVYDIEQNTLESINLAQNSATVDFTELLKEYQIEAVISSGYTMMVLKLFKVLKISTFRASGDDVAENLESFKNGLLPRYTFLDAMEASKENCDADACGLCATVC
jgi:predicted Fe-Mo cluster-binding NifX family protein